MMSKGSLILVCRSDQLEHFSWFARRLHDQLLAEGQTDITIIQVTSSAQLQDALLACPAPHDVADIHIFGEFKDDRLWVDQHAREWLKPESIPDSKAAATATFAIASYAQSATCKVWFWADSQNAQVCGPGFEILKSFEACFGHRFSFSPIGQLKQRSPKSVIDQKKGLDPSVVKIDVRTPADEPARGAPAAVNVSLNHIVAALVGIGLIYSFVIDSDLDYSGSFDEGEVYQDTSYDIDKITAGMIVKSGEMSKHVWIYDRKKWAYEWFLADEWLEAADRELSAALETTGGGRWPVIYNQLLEKNQDRLTSVARSLKRAADKHGYDRYELASLTLAFVQHIPYKIPRNELGLMTPPTTLSKRWGDCDTKSLLYVLVMQQLGFDVSLFISNRYRHAMAGVNINAVGTSMAHRGRQYFFAETTTPGHRIGQLKTGNGRTASWSLIPLTNSASGGI
jgi:hypothetical protein